ncbi:hypothetical protein NONI108955_29425 [Nocardia ninae]
MEGPALLESVSAAVVRKTSGCVVERDGTPKGAASPGAVLACFHSAPTALESLETKTNSRGSDLRSGKSWSNSCWARRVGLFGGRYFSLSPPNARLPTGRISSTSPSTSGTNILTGWRMTHRVLRPQNPFSTSSAGLVLRNRLIPSMSTRGPRTASIAGRIVMAVSAAIDTVAIAP